MTQMVAVPVISIKKGNLISAITSNLINKDDTFIIRFAQIDIDKDY